MLDIFRLFPVGGKNCEQPRLNGVYAFVEEFAELMSRLLRFGLIHCTFPVFVFLLVFTLGLRDFTRIVDFRGLLRNLVRRFFL